MSELIQRIYEHFKHHDTYIYSSDSSIKSLEIDAVKELEKSNYIVVKMRTIGYVIADVL